MSDDRLRELERAWRVSGSVTDEVAWLLERLRCGDVSELSLRACARMGHAAARAALGADAPAETPPDAAQWLMHT